MEKQILVDAILGKGFRSMQFAIDMTNAGLAKFTGNQWNEKWDWKKEELLKLPIDQLAVLYKKEA